MSVVLGILGGGFKNCKFLFLSDHTQVGARNVSCRDAINEGMDYLFFVDSDMDFPVDTLQRLKDCDADIACTDMWSRSIPSFRTIMMNSKPDENGKRVTVPVPQEIVDKKARAEVDVCGMACTLIKTSLLKRMRERMEVDAWFQSVAHGEDASFCFMAKDLYGAKIVCDFGITAGHWGVMRMAGQDFTRDAANQPMQVANREMMKRMGALNL